MTGRSHAVPLANDSYRQLSSLSDGDDTLNLAWTADEREFLAVDTMALLGAELADEVATGLPTVGSYLVRDPYGEQWLRPALAGLYPLGPAGVTAAAGVIPLLHAFTGLARDAPVYVIGDVYPDLPHWVAAAGGRCVCTPGADLAGHLAGVAASGAALVLLERPELTGAALPLADLRSLATGVGPDVIVLVDEAYANYHPLSYTALPLCAEVDNLLVVRGLAKAYGMGGLRLGYCVSSAELTGRVRALVPPMLPASLSLRLGRALLGLGDIAGPLRERVARARTELTDLLAAQDIHGATWASEHIPFVFFEDEQDPGPVRLRAAGIVGKRHTYWSERSRGPAYRYRLSVPLRRDRMADLHRRLTGRA